MDWAKLAEGLYDGARGMLGFMGGADLPFDVTTLPDAGTFTRFYEPSVYWSRITEAGTYLRAESSFGPETLLGLGLLGGGVFLGLRAVTELEAEVEEAPAPPAASEPEDAPAEPRKDPGVTTRETMDFLATRLAVYRLETGRYPASLDVLLDPTEAYPRGFLGGDTLPVDGWGRSFSFAASENGATFRLWSVGADGVDQMGEGDDLVHG
jgi:hypothetical protein